MEDMYASSVRRSRRRWPLVVAVFSVMLLLGMYWGWNVATQTETGIVLLSGTPALLPSHRLALNLSSTDNDVVRESLAVLADRKDPVGIQGALPLLKSKDPYVWFNASLYLGAVKRTESVPYLIKALRHNAYRSYGDCASDLTSITGMTFGTDFKKWHEWWMATNPSSGFDFDSSLGK